MNASQSARDEILARVRTNLALARAELGGHETRPLRPDETRIPGAPQDLTREAARIERFREKLESVGGKCAVVSDEEQAAEYLAKLVREKGVERLATSDAPVAQRLADRLRSAKAPPTVLPIGSDKGELMDCQLGLSSAQWGIAETGTLVLESERERHRLVSLVPPVHVAVLEAETILPTLGEALSVVRGDPTVPMSRAVTLVTGPSRTADIELTLVVGVHGPKELHVLLLQRKAS